MPSPRSSILAALVIMGGATLAYHNTFSVPFLFDDDSSISENPTIRSLTTALTPPAGGGHTVSGRPFLNFTLGLNYAVHGTAVWGYHLVNLLIHMAAGCTLFGIVRRTLLAVGRDRLIPPSSGRGKAFEAGSAVSTSSRPRACRGAIPPCKTDSTWLALAVALLWTLHPLQTQAVTYIIQRAESLVSLLYLLTLWCFIRAVEPNASKLWTALAWIACLLGMATKEVMVTAPVMIVLYDRIFVTGSWREVWVRRKGFHLGLALTWLLLAWLVAGTAGRGGTAGFGGEISPWDYALMQVGAVVHYLRLALWPQPLVFDYGKDLVVAGGAVGVQALLLLPLMGASLWMAGKGRAAGYLGVFFFAVLAPSSSFVPVITQTMSEHRVYLALAAVVTLVVTGLYAWLGRKSFVVFVVLAVGLTAATVRRNHDYRSELAIWEDAVVKRPGNVRALAALGAIHQKAGRLEESQVLLQEAVRLAPASHEAQNNLGNAWMKTARWAEAIACFERALGLKPDDPDILNNLGNALLQAGRGPEAITLFEKALWLKPDFTEPRYNLANLFAQSGRFAEATPHFARLVELTPEDAEARSNYGDVLLELGRGPEAIAQYETAVRLQPARAELHNNLGVAFARLDRPAEAVPHFQQALQLQPDFAGARENLSRATRTPGR